MTTTSTATTTASILSISPATWAAAPSRDRDRAAYLLRLERLPLAEIGAALGYGRGTGTISRAIRRQMVREGLLTADEARTLSSAGRRFGVEIELVGLNVTAAVDALVAAGINAYTPVGQYNHATPAPGSWKVVYDGSVYGGAEVVSPPLSGEAGFAEVRRVVDALRAAGARVNGSCGLHVHHEATDLTGDQLGAVVEFYARHQQVLDSFVARSRRAAARAPYCAPLAAREVTAIVSRLRTITATDASGKISQARVAGIGDRPSARYRTVNVYSFGNYGTLEFRQHQGTLNGRKIEAWVRLGQAIIDAAAAAATVRSDAFLADLVSAGHLDDETARYMGARQAALA